VEKSPPWPLQVAPKVRAANPKKELPGLIDSQKRGRLSLALVG
jgi:hypothetical protein